MKSLLRVLVLLSLLLIVFFYMSNSAIENETLKAPSTAIPEDEVPSTNGSSDMLPRPKEGFSTFIGKSKEALVEKIGEPQRIAPSAYDFDWWVYTIGQDEYLLAGVENKKVVQVFLTGAAADFAPFKVGQSLEDLYRNTITDMEVSVEIDKNIYTFIMNEQDLRSKILLMYDGMYAQLYFDGVDDRLVAVRYLNGETLVKMQPYDMSFVGEQVKAKAPSSFKQQQINAENAAQLSELVNVFRSSKQLPVLSTDLSVQMLSQQHSEFLARSETAADKLKTRLKNADISFSSAAENIAEDYRDAPEAVNGFLNSQQHRKDLINDEFNFTGTGAFGEYYTQIFIEQKAEK